MKYCIGCVHLHFEKGSDGWCTEVTAGIDAHEAEFACKKRHWRSDIADSGDLPNIERLMMKAETCPDFSERSHPSARGDPK